MVIKHIQVNIKEQRRKAILITTENVFFSEDFEDTIAIYDSKMEGLQQFVLEELKSLQRNTLGEYRIRRKNNEAFFINICNTSLQVHVIFATGTCNIRYRYRDSYIVESLTKTYRCMNGFR